MLEVVVSRSAKQRVLTYLADLPSQALFENQVAQGSGVSMAATHYAMHALAAEGLLRRETRGRRCAYGVDLAHPVVRQWKVLLTLARLEPLLSALRPVADRVVLFGSCATGTDHEDSDVDLYVRTALPEEARKIVEAKPQGRRVQLVAKTVLEEAESERDSPVFLENVRRGLVLYDEGVGL
jgi:predicted nucleotidyltransferase